MAAERPEPSKRTAKTWAWTGVQVLIGVGAGLLLAKTMQLPEEQIALIGTVITLITWLADESVKLPAKDTRLGAGIHGTFRSCPW